MSITSRSFVQSTAALLIVGFLALLAIVGVTFWLGERAQVYFKDVIEARDTRSAAVDLRNAVQAAESSQRGFLFTGNEIYLAPYDSAKALALRQLDAVSRMLAPQNAPSASVQRLTTVVTDKFSEMDQTIALKRAGQDAEVLAVVRTNRGKALMDEANVFLSGIIRAADDRLTTGVGEQRSNATWLRWISIIGGITIVAVTGGASITVLSYTRELGAARDEVGALNAGLEEHVKIRTADLAQANEEIQRFAQIITHDLRAPLVNIAGFTRELEDGLISLQALIAAGSNPTAPVFEAARLAATEDLPEAIGFIRTSARKMDTLINAILKLSREGRRTLRPERIQIKDVIMTSAAAIQHQLSEASGEISFDLDIPPIVNDKLSLEQIFGNLLDNSIKYRSQNRPLRIDVRGRVAPGNRVSIEIADNGRGIADQDKQRIFELFRRSGIQDQPGDGIGLAYVLASVRNLGGEIAVTSALEQGTTFRVILPRTLRAVQTSPA